MKKAVREYMAEIGKRGGKARAQRLSSRRRRAIAAKAGKVGGKARWRKRKTAR